MELPSSLEPPLIKICDLIFALIPREVPSLENLQKCKIISHRGQHDNVEIVENTFNAFDVSLNTKGVWGIELDIRWTKDLCPVVFHDPDLQRLYGLKIRISETTRSKLKKLFPQIPTLKEIVSRYGEKLHLMVEAKEELNVQTQKQNKILEDIFQKLEPSKDFHLLALNPKILDTINFVDASSKIIVAIFNEKWLSKISLDKNYSGIGGHYLLISNKIIQQHLNFGQKIGVGYPNSKNSLFREINRGVEWIFCNDAVNLSNILQDELEKTKSNVFIQ